MNALYEVTLISAKGRCAWQVIAANGALAARTALAAIPQPLPRCTVKIKQVPHAR